jgi:predicted DNA-binding transcriptional regulator YafY
MMSSKGSWGRRTTLIPLRILSNTKTGRRYVAIYNARNKKFSTVRLDYIKDVAFAEEFPEFDSVCAEYQYLLKGSFSITHKKTESLQRVKMLLYIDEMAEQFVIERIKREGKDGIISKIEENIFEYTVEVTDTLEMVPWLRTFTGRIIELQGSESRVIAQFKRDISTMISLYNE